VNSVEKNLLHCHESHPDPSAARECCPQNEWHYDSLRLCCIVESENKTINNILSLGCSSCVADIESRTEERVLKKYKNTSQSRKPFLSNSRSILLQKVNQNWD
jgi:hypothetical protein